MITNIDIVAAELKKLVRLYPDIVADECEKAMELIVIVMEGKVMALTPQGVGGAAGLRGSIAGEVTEASRKRIAGAVGTPLKYGEVIEYGRKPGKMPPVAPLVLWARRKLGMDDAAAQSFGFAVARKLKYNKFATIPEGARMFEKGWEETRPSVGILLEKALQNIKDRVKVL